NPSWFGIGEYQGQSIRETTQSKRHPRFRLKSKHTVEIDVDSQFEDTSILVTLDDNQFTFTGRTADLDVSDNEYRWPDKQKLRVGRVNSRYRLHKLTLEPLTSRSSTKK